MIGGCPSPTGGGRRLPTVREGAEQHERVGALRRDVVRPGARAPPAAGQGARREVGDAHRLRHGQRLGLRGGRHPGDAGRRLRRQRRPRALQHGAGHRRRHPADDQGGHPLDEAVADRRRHALRQLRVRPRAGAGHRGPVPEGGRRAGGQARGRRAGRAADPADHRGRHPGDGAHRVHAAERARPRRLPGAGPRRGRGQAARRRARRPGGRGVRRRHGDGARPSWPRR